MRVPLLNRLRWICPNLMCQEFPRPRPSFPCQRMFCVLRSSLEVPGLCLLYIKKKKTSIKNRRKKKKGGRDPKKSTFIMHRGSGRRARKWGGRTWDRTRPLKNKNKYKKKKPCFCGLLRFESRDWPRLLQTSWPVELWNGFRGLTACVGRCQPSVLTIPPPGGVGESRVLLFLCLVFGPFACVRSIANLGAWLEPEKCGCKMDAVVLRSSANGWKANDVITLQLILTVFSKKNVIRNPQCFLTTREKNKQTQTNLKKITSSKFGRLSMAR